MADSIQNPYEGLDPDSIFETGEVFDSGNDSLDFDIFKGEKLDSLRGIPFAILGGVFRENVTDKGDISDYVTLTCLIPSEKQLESRHVRVTGKELWFPGQLFGINDGSTGIRRQMVAYLHNSGFIQVCEPGSVPKEDGPRNECTWDTMVSAWHSIEDSEKPRTSKTHKRTGAELTTWEFKLEKPLVIARGIRTSTYLGPFRKEITTRYLA
jgi:hypothetical protein